MTRDNRSTDLRLRACVHMKGTLTRIFSRGGKTARNKRCTGSRRGVGTRDEYLHYNYLTKDGNTSNMIHIRNRKLMSRK